MTADHPYKSNVCRYAIFVRELFHTDPVRETGVYGPVTHDPPGTLHLHPENGENQSTVTLQPRHVCRPSNGHVIWSDLIRSDLIRSDLFWSDPIWSDLTSSDLIWSDLIDLIWSDLTWSDLIWSDLIWSGLIRPGLTCPDHWLRKLSIHWNPSW